MCGPTAAPALAVTTQRSLVAARKALPGTGDVSAETSTDQRNADARVHLAAAAVGNGLDGAQTTAAARHEVVVHADVDFLCVHTEVDTTRMRCHIEDVVEGADGQPGRGSGRREPGVEHDPGAVVADLDRAGAEEPALAVAEGQ